MSWALSAFADQTFEDWAHDTSVTYGRDTVDEQLLPAALTASYLGDHGAWRQTQSLLGRHHLVRLDRNCDPEEGRIGLDLLQQAGDEATLKRAVLRIAADGPANAITLAAADIQLDKATRTTAPADLAFLRYGGDLLDRTTAERTVAWLLAALDDPTTFATRTSPSYDVRLRLIDTLAGVVPAAPPAARDAVINLMTTLPAQGDQAHATSWARVGYALPEDSWTASAAQQLLARSSGDHWALLNLARALAAPHDPGTWASLLSEVRSGGWWWALAAFSDVRDLPEDVAASLIPRLSVQVAQQISSAHAGLYAWGGVDYGRTLALLNARFPGHADWEPVYALLPDRAVAVDHKAGAMEVLAALAEDIPGEVRARLGAIAKSIAQDQRPAARSRNGHKTTRGVAAHLATALGALDASESSECLLKLLAGTPDDRLWAIRMASRTDQPDNLGLLIGLCQAPEPDLRANAAAGLAALVASGSGGNLAAATLRQYLKDPGTTVPRGIVEALTAAPTLAPAAQDALAALHGHQSALVRKTSHRSPGGS